jgi:hypothetical protein
MLRILLRLAAALCMMCVAGSALAQDPRTIAVQTAARDWLEIVDTGNAKAAWNAAAKRFRTTLSEPLWTDEINKEQARLGKMKRRTVGPTRFQSKIPGLPDGQYAQILFRTSFANKSDGIESLTLERESDAVWRVIGYFPRAK